MLRQISKAVDVAVRKSEDKAAGAMLDVVEYVRKVHEECPGHPSRGFVGRLRWLLLGR